MGMPPKAASLNEYHCLRDTLYLARETKQFLCQPAKHPSCWWESFWAGSLIRIGISVLAPLLCQHFVKCLLNNTIQELLIIIFYQGDGQQPAESLCASCAAPRFHYNQGQLCLFKHLQYYSCTSISVSSFITGVRNELGCMRQLSPFRGWRSRSLKCCNCFANNIYISMRYCSENKPNTTSQLMGLAASSS